MNFLVNPRLFSMNLYFLDPKEDCLISWILNLMVFPGMEGKLISKFGLMCKKMFNFIFIILYNFINYLNKLNINFILKGKINKSRPCFSIFLNEKFFTIFLIPHLILQFFILNSQFYIFFLLLFLIS